MGPNWAIFGVGVGLENFLGSTHVVEQLLFSLFLSILTFDFDSNLGSFFNIWALTGYFLGWGRAQQLIWGLLM